MFMNGNFGLKGEKEIYNIIDSDNKIFLIDDTHRHWQEPTKIINYIKDKYQICSSVEHFTVYCKKH